MLTCCQYAVLKAFTNTCHLRSSLNFSRCGWTGCRVGDTDDKWPQSTVGGWTWAPLMWWGDSSHLLARRKSHFLLLSPQFIPPCGDRIISGHQHSELESEALILTHWVCSQQPQGSQNKTYAKEICRLFFHQVWCPCIYIYRERVTINLFNYAFSSSTQRKAPISLTVR